jgi:hypothetical protein
MTTCQLEAWCEAAGLLRRATFLSQRLTLDFDWGRVYIILDTKEAESVCQALSERVGTKVAVLLVTDSNNDQVLMLREVSH